MEEKNYEIEVQRPYQPTPMELIAKAHDRGASLESIQQLMDLQDRMEAKEARKAYNHAVACFRAKGIKIVKAKHVKFQTTRGTTEYTHAELGDVVEAIVPALSAFGLSHNWHIEQDDEIKITCQLSHVDGHSESVSLKASPDDSGGKNKIQQVGSTITYLQRYTLLAITGLATHGVDDDGKNSGPPEEPTLDDNQLANIEALIMETGADVKKFCTFLRVNEITSIKAKDYPAAVKALEKKRGA
jgi:hypothetical protein